MDNRGNRPYRSFFWPILLIGVGAIWLLSNFGLIPTSSLSLLFSLWPLILVVIGLDLLFGRSSPLVGGLIGLLLVGALLFALLAGPMLGIKAPAGSEVKQERFSEPIGQATTAVFRLDSGSEPVEISPLADGDLLVDADITHTGVMDFSVNGTSEKTITLRKLPASGFGFSAGDFAPRKWKIGLTNRIPLNLTVDSGSGPVDMDLSGVKLTGLDLNSGSGSISMLLPNSDTHYEARIESGSGSVSVRLPGGTDMTLVTDTGSGALDIQIPTDTAVRLEVLDNGSGSIHVPATMTRISGNGNEDQGTWEKQGPPGSTRKLLIQVRGLGSGSLSIR